MKQIIFCFLFFGMYTTNVWAQPKTKTSTSTVEQRKMDQFISQLMKKMTLTEKLGQLNLPGAGDITTGQASSSNIAQKIKEGKVGGLFNIKGVEKIREVQKLAVENSRLKIPLLFGMDVIHGYQTVFPIPLGLSATWDMEAVRASAALAAKEASADGISWTFSPMVDLTRDARWGRVSEGNGEDPFLSSAIAKAMVEGYQGKDLKADNTILACVKHYALYGAAEAGRDYGTVDMSRQRMYNEYFPPYKAAVDAGVGSVMASFNEVDGIPATANKWLMDDVLRKQWGFNGFVVTDYTGINEMVDHGIGDLQEVSARALQAGIDMDMVGEGLLTTLEKSLQEKKITMAMIDQACRRILEAKYKLGLFDDPYKYCNPERAKKEVFTKENRAESRRIAAESLVLMKNEGNILPLQKNAKIALVGPLGNNAKNMPGTWSVAALFDQAIPLLQGLQEVSGSPSLIQYVQGCNLDYDLEFQKRATLFGKTIHRDERPTEVIIAEAVEAARNADVVVAALGESAEMSGESSSRTDIQIPSAQRDLLEALKKTGKPIVLVLFTGRPLDLSWESKNIPAILNVWFPGSEAGYAIADVLYGKVNPSGKITMSFPQNVGQVPLFYNHKNTGRPLPDGKWFQKFRSNYLDVSNDPLYPFGYGLSYTQFEYGKPTINKLQMNKKDTIRVSVTLRNTGKFAGKEVVQWYIRDVVGSTTRPVKELKGFEKVLLQPGETKTVHFDIHLDLLKFYNYNLDWVAESGEFQVMVGPNSRDTQMLSFVLTNN